MFHHKGLHRGPYLPPCDSPFVFQTSSKQKRLFPPLTSDSFLWVGIMSKEGQLYGHVQGIWIKHKQGWIKLKDAYSWKKTYDQPRQHIKKQRHYFANKGPSSQSYGFSSSHVWMWELDYKKSWASKNWCFWTVMLEKTPESLLACKEIQPINLKRNQS